MKKWLIICLAVAIVAVGVAGFMGYKVYSATQITEEQLVAVNWAQSHPKDAELLRLVPVNRIYAATWKNNNATTLSLFVDSNWVDVIMSDQPETKSP